MTDIERIHKYLNRSMKTPLDVLEACERLMKSTPSQEEEEIILKSTLPHRDNYGTDITIDELKSHYEKHFLTSNEFIQLINDWHKKE